LCRTRRLLALLARPQARQRLPILAIQQQLVEALRRQDVVVVSGDTGCGKTTQARRRRPGS
jgi:HrpA-like RNA helicase